MSQLNEQIPLAVHLADIVNGECSCPYEERLAILARGVLVVQRYTALITELEHVRDNTSVGDFWSLASELLDTHGE